MAMNPMQRKANNSFLLGIVITLLITGIIIGFLILQISKLNKEIDEAKAQTVQAYVVVDTIKSGADVTEENVEKIEMNLNTRIDTSVLYTQVPYEVKAKVDLNPGTILTTDLTYEGETIGNDVRTQEYNVIILPSQIESGEYIDIRLRTPDGRDLIVLSHKEVTIPTLEGVDSSGCIWLDMKEEETLIMSSAIVETYKIEGAKLYATKYVEPGMQTAASITYVPSAEVEALIRSDSNIINEAKTALLTELNKNRDLVRQGLNNAINSSENAADNVVDKTEEEIQGLLEEREKYIESLGG